MDEGSQSSVKNIYPVNMTDDLEKSGLTPADLKAKPITPAEKAATMTPMGVEGYVIPYFDLRGQALPFYRVRLFDHAAKYRQIADSPNHVYFPPRLLDIIGSAKYVILTEGEKKAAAAVKLGYPCVALGGVDSWRSRTIALPKDTSIAQKPDGKLSVRLPPGGRPGEPVDTIAQGLRELVDLVVTKKIPILICYDTEALPNGGYGIKTEVQRAAASLAFELRHRGVPLKQIRQLILPTIPGISKTGLDDLLVEDEGADLLSGAILRCLEARSAFPRHPNPREYVSRKLQRPQMSRPEQIGVGLAVLSDMDARGQRLRSPDDEQFYYFSHEAKTLTKVSFSGRPDFAESGFGRMLYREYGLGINDQKILGWLSTQFAAEDPISDVFPEKVLAWRGDTLYYQINNGSMARINKDHIDILDNGEDNVLFESGLVDELDTEDFRKALVVARTQKLENWWLDVLQQARIKDSDGDKQRRLLSLLYYVSPMFYRWRGTQLPVEITTGEAGSGKSTLFTLRLSILTGVPTLRNSPSDLKDWNAGLASTGALHVTDNVAFKNNDLRQRLSDEICRLVTEPRPSIEQRKLYTDVGLIKIPVRVVFALTAIKQPFQNVDIIQRSIITELDKGISSDLTYDTAWTDNRLSDRGGRIMWLAHMMGFVQRLLARIDKDWDPKYRAKYRLINLEQLLILTAKEFGADEGKWIAPYLESSRDQRATETDWALAGLVAFAAYIKSRNPAGYRQLKLPIDAIPKWITGEDDFLECQLLMNTRSLVRYIEQHKHTVATTAGLTINSDGMGKLTISFDESR